MKLINGLLIMLLIAPVLMAQEALSHSKSHFQPSPNEVLNGQRSLRIMGGQNTDAGAMPWIVFIKYEDESGFVCSGSLIHPYWVLTAAHCMDGYLNGENVSVIVGLHQRTQLEAGEHIEVTQVIQHPGWNESNPYNFYDIALLQLKKPSTQPPVSLFSPENQPITAGTMATVMGWGLTSADEKSAGPDVLQEVELPVVTNATCQTAYNQENRILDSMLCAGYAEGQKDACPGDSGGPLVTLINNQWTQIGIVSFGGKEDGPICGGPKAYGVYTRVSAYLDFILNYVPLAMTTGIYDGVWTSSAWPNIFVLLRNTAETIAVIFLNEKSQNWQALLGPLTYPTMTVTNFIAPTQMIFELKPIMTVSPPIREISLTSIVCLPMAKNDENTCFLSEGHTMTLKKIF